MHGIEQEHSSPLPTRVILGLADGIPPARVACQQCRDGRVRRIVPCIAVPQPAWRGGVPMRISSLFPHARSCRVDDVRVSDGALTIALTSTRTTATCPSCRRRSRHPHSRYRRRVADQPWAGHPVTVVLHGRRFLCRTPQCPRRTFRERFPALVAPCARRSDGLRTALARIGLAAGGEAGARLAAALGMPTSASTLLRAVRAVPATAPAAPSIVGLDDWSRRRGRPFGTIVVDLERQRPVDLLPHRHPHSVAPWLPRRPGITLVAP